MCALKVQGQSTVVHITTEVRVSITINRNACFGDLFVVLVLSTQTPVSLAIDNSINQHRHPYHSPLTTVSLNTDTRITHHWQQYHSTQTPVSLTTDNSTTQHRHPYHSPLTTVSLNTDTRITHHWQQYHSTQTPVSLTTDKERDYLFYSADSSASSNTNVYIHGKETIRNWYSEFFGCRRSGQGYILTCSGLYECWTVQNNFWYFSSPCSWQDTHNACRL